MNGRFNRVGRYIARAREAGLLHSVRIAGARFSGYLQWPTRTWSLIRGHHIAPGLAPEIPQSITLQGEGFDLFWEAEEIDRIGRALRQDSTGIAGEIVERADRLLEEGITLLGWGRAALRRPVDWHSDARTKVRWPIRFHKMVNTVRERDTCDVKYPWELSRLQGLPVLAQAWRVTENPRYLREAWDILADWSTGNPPGFGVNWTCSMEVAIRAMNIATMANLVSTSLPPGHRAFLRRLLEAHEQHLRLNLELSEVNGNHLLFDYLGLALLGAVLHGLQSEAYLRAADALAEEAELQFHPDGVHIEHATGYHRLVLEGLLLFLAATRRHDGEARRRLWLIAEKALPFLEAICERDGALPAMGDSDSGNVLTLGSTLGNNAAALLEYYAAVGLGGPAEDRVLDRASRAWMNPAWGTAPDRGTGMAGTENEEIRLFSFADSGYFVVRGGGMTLVLRAGPSGLRGRGSHDHNDQLSLVLTAHGRPLLVDPGTFTYTEDVTQHARDLATNRHNTVSVNGVEQSPIHQGSVTCAVRCAMGACEHFDMDAQGRVVWQAAVPYGLPAEHAWRHERRVILSRDSAGLMDLEILDMVRSSAGQPPPATVNFMLDPSCPVHARGPEAILQPQGDMTCIATLLEGGPAWALNEDRVSLEYGAFESTHRLSAALNEQGECRVRLRIRTACIREEAGSETGTSHGRCE